MKKVLMILSISLFLFSCGETNKSEKTESSEVNDSQNVKDQIVGKWKLKTVGGALQDGTMTINNDNTCLVNGMEGIWSIKDNNFCRELVGENLPDILKKETCFIVNINGGQLSLNTEVGIESIYEK